MIRKRRWVNADLIKLDPGEKMIYALSRAQVLLLAFIFLLLVSGCGTAPSKVVCPEVFIPSELMQEPEPPIPLYDLDEQ